MKTFDPTRKCISCGYPVESLSFGGPDMCPACDCGGKEQRLEVEIKRLEAKNQLLQMELTQALKERK